ncbi:bactofilin family protein [Mucilaginibacter auburnensis]|uniref:Polymer-forming protein n=1 Tax=Mucilaginibacter auburnensis TaxID=1457233 RepID=A0A2H9VR21_9SPHI|nr:polymer-forming cytoskeletal protein [Mucilaginibacter auburnensis]PJJ83265.1 polymer-forming protein [Mucilaginibacter auburnensis]
MGLLKKNTEAAIYKQTVTTLISEGSVVSGSLTAKAFARIDGHIKGDVEISEGIILGKHGSIDGHVRTKEMVVHGKVNGNITVNSIEIGATGVVTGDITTASLSVETGGVYNGRLVMHT